MFEASPVYRKDGKVRVVSEIDKNIMTWFQMPSLLKEYPIEAGHDPSEEKILRDHNHWPVEVLKALVFKQKPEIFNAQLPSLNFPQMEKDNQRVLAKVIPGKNRWRFMIGTPWEIYRSKTDESLRCILDEWNRKDYSQFSTDAVLYVMDETDEKIHNYLDEETILDYFKLKKREVWVCVNENQESFLRVVTELVGIVPMQLIEHYDSVQVESVEITGEYGEQSNTAKITETKIVDANTLQTVRYDGLVKILGENPPPTPQPVRRKPSLMKRTTKLFGKIFHSGY
ncbi:uncharacterized protein LOC111054471 isoform X1 [Nilaparvata lugens]|uniref:uncharacterized protein LOC111054471 isoform X1 n=1 Tax=Nilaparvata lugens TaxID=108931 RepID=UPI00193CAB29|nr:uncharacterized protein LOC111054471 isoform X1 [Nilaparvata lugens]